jgi:hypothetical protein
LGFQKGELQVYSGIVVAEYIPVLPEAIRKSFRTALILSGSPAAAEEALLESIRTHNLQERPLHESVIEAAIARSVPPRAEAPEMLPVELQRVLGLPQILRHCYVLKILERCPSDVCARILGIDSREVEDHACLAAAELARITVQELAAAPSNA